MKMYSYKKPKKQAKPVGDYCINCIHSDDEPHKIPNLLSCYYMEWTEPYGMTCKYFKRK